MDKNAPIPKCPYCDAEMPALGLFSWQVPNFIILATYCATCKVALNFQTLPATQAPEEKRIARPG
jgi:hypothetical protein